MYSILDQFRGIVGVLPDSEVAKQAGVHANTVYKYRKALGIGSGSTPPPKAAATPKATVTSKVAPKRWSYSPESNVATLHKERNRWKSLPKGIRAEIHAFLKAFMEDTTTPCPRELTKEFPCSGARSFLAFALLAFPVPVPMNVLTALHRSIRGVATEGSFLRQLVEQAVRTYPDDVRILPAARSRNSGVPKSRVALSKATPSKAAPTKIEPKRITPVTPVEAEAIFAAWEHGGSFYDIAKQVLGSATRSRIVQFLIEGRISSGATVFEEYKNRRKSAVLKRASSKATAEGVVGHIQAIQASEALATLRRRERVAEMEPVPDATASAPSKTDVLPYFIDLAAEAGRKHGAVEMWREGLAYHFTVVSTGVRVSVQG